MCKEFLEKVLEFRKINKLNTDYIVGTKKSILYNEENRIFCDFRFEGTRTGRLSCAAQSDRIGKMGVSFHTLSSEDEYNIRTMYCAEEEEIFITADYSTMELRILALIAREEGMLEAFNAGKDLHTYTASTLFGGKYEAVKKPQRKIAKTANFLIVYGGGAYNLAMTAGIQMRAAKEVFRKYEVEFPRVFQYMKEVERNIFRDKYVTTIFGRRRNLPNIDSPNEKIVKKAIRQGVNCTIQSPASDILLFAVEGYCEDVGTSEHLKAVVHDSAELSVPKKDWIKHITVLYYNMIENPRLKTAFSEIDFDVPFEVEIKVGKSFGEGIEVKFINGVISNLQEVENYLTEKGLL